MNYPVGVAGETEGRVPPSQLAEQFALDTVLYCHTFFPKTFRQRTAPFHREIFEILDNPANREIALEVFRGGAKTTNLRVYTSKRIAYGASRTILYISASQGHSLKSIRWIRKQVEFNKAWADFYGLTKGGKWTDEHLEIYHATLGISITLLAVGITGQTRGINVDDYRPDLIVVDDADNEETTATEEQREKTKKLFFGSILRSLTPRSENPEAKIVVLATSLHKDDLINKCHASAAWTTRKFPILDENQESIWPLRHPTEEVLADKATETAEGRLLLWLREMECTVGNEETAFFRANCLNYWDALPDRMITVVTCDPAPPPSESQLRNGLKTKDEEVWSVQGLFKGEYYLLEQVAARDHDPEWSIATFFALCLRWRPIRVRIETIAYQRTLKHLILKAMQDKKLYFMVEDFKDPRKKRHRILQSLAGISSQGHLWVHPSQQGFIDQFSTYPNVTFDDRLDAAAMGFDALQELAALDDMDGLLGEDDQMNTLDWSRSAP